MFKFLKDKLKSALAKITKKVEEEAPEEVIEQVVEQPKETKKPKAEKPVKQKKESKPKKEKKQKKETVVEEPQEEVKEELIAAAKPEPVKEEISPVEQVTPETKSEEQPAQKKGFFSRLFKKKDEIAEEITAPEEKKEEVTPPATVPEEAVEEKKGFFGKLKEKIVTKKITAEKFAELFWELEVVMLENNVAVAVIDRIKTELQHRLVDKPLQRGQIEKIIQQSLRESIEKVLSVPTIDVIKSIKEKLEKPYVIVFVGVNGSGKTTTLAKFANLCLEHKLSVVLGAGDSFRKGAIEQLEEWGRRLGVKVIKQQYGSDSAAICWDAVNFAKRNELDVVLLDTAGRQHSNTNLMREMEKIIRVVKPDLKIFIGESITGNDVLTQADEFNKTIGIDGIILTKADVDDKGGAMISVAYVTGKPILYLGTGQLVSGLKEFNKDDIIKSLGL